MAYPVYSEAELARFRSAQRLAYDAAESVARSLTPGTTEKEAARALDRAVRSRGVTEFFHQPFAWFGDRATFADFRTPLAFFPTDRRLDRGMPFILDVAPVVDGCIGDIGYTFALGDTWVLREAERLLAALRPRILELVLAERSMKAIYKEVDRIIGDAGFTSCHAKYPFAVLAHKVHQPFLPALRRHTFLGFGRGGLEIVGRWAASMLPHPSHITPLWNDSRLADQRVEPGLWAVEPHVGKGGVGAKWEEMLLVTDTTARWLDDDVPHVRAWRAKPAGLGAPPVEPVNGEPLHARL